MIFIWICRNLNVLGCVTVAFSFTVFLLNQYLVHSGVKDELRINTIVILTPVYDRNSVLVI